jgi:uracil-DNA glycosylase
MKGFFTTQETQSQERPDGKTYSCVSCGLYKDAKSPKMKSYGNFRKHILVIGEAPGELEDIRGLPWQGKTGKLLQQTCKELGVDLFEDCLNINAVNCHPKANKTPVNYEIDCCRSVIVNNVIKEYQPKLIILLGRSALYSFLGHRWKKDLSGISKWRGFTIPDQDFKCWVCPTFHPSYVERGDKEVETIWRQDLQQALKKVDEKFPRNKKPKIIHLQKLDQLNEIQDGGLVAFDYETTGIKPHASGHRIICASVAVSQDECFVFRMPETKYDRIPFLQLLSNPLVQKMAHNIKFEETWSVQKLKTPVQGWIWDSMQAAHVLDNRHGITGLKFQTYVNFGIIDYDSEVTPYLQSGSKDGNAVNSIQKLLDRPGGEEMLMEYCSLDSIYEYRLAWKQMKLLGYDFLPF